MKSTGEESSRLLASCNCTWCWRAVCCRHLLPAVWCGWRRECFCMLRVLGGTKPFAGMDILVVIFFSLSLSSWKQDQSIVSIVTDRSGPWSKKWMPRINREHPVLAFWQRVYSSCVKRVSSKVKLPNSNSRLKRSFLLQVIYSAKLTYLPLQCKCLVCANIWLTEVSGERKLDEFFRCLSWRYNNAASFSVVVQRWSSFEFVMKINTKQMPGLSQSDFPNKATLL